MSSHDEFSAAVNALKLLVGQKATTKGKFTEDVFVLEQKIRVPVGINGLLLKGRDDYLQKRIAYDRQVTLILLFGDGEPVTYPVWRGLRHKTSSSTKACQLILTRDTDVDRKLYVILNPGPGVQNFLAYETLTIAGLELPQQDHMIERLLTFDDVAFFRRCVNLV